MREIKFRVWDKTEKKMLDTVESWNKVWWDDTSPENEYDYHSRCLYIDNQGHVLEHTDEHGMCDTHYLLQGEPKYDLMQYTGLYDKNGKEIYEGDIITKSALSKIGYEVYWHTDTACWQLRNPLYCGFTGITKSNCALMCEVIGNVFEHPELLKQEA